ncbi:MAG: cob(I)yrinic acid a,c-diamide adenosyltransferase [Synergistaceae bacterium]|jgi:ATP:cob(I)alamin adenosyltransferase|nr:cob(I)yrinic acid a,c-diamide adenosyltransferase [Synergistaceae bacterium]
MGRVYTRTGDGGETRLGSREKVPKDARRVALYGTLDEANSALGMARRDAAAAVASAISELQTGMTRLMSRFSLYDMKGPALSASDIEKRIEAVREIVPMPDAFVTPGESRAGAALHLARAIVRRAEREAVALSREENVDAEDLKAVNRLSDYIFALAEWADYEEKVERITRLVADSFKKGAADMTLDVAERLLLAMREKAEKGGVPMAMAVCDAQGELVLFARQEGVLPVSVGLARKKAFTAAQLRLPTSELAELTRPGAMLWGLQSDSNLVVFGGGIPLFSEGNEAEGAVGVSGGTVDEDVAVAKAALEAWEKIRIVR